MSRTGRQEPEKGVTYRAGRFVVVVVVFLCGGRKASAKASKHKEPHEARANDVRGATRFGGSETDDRGMTSGRQEPALSLSLFLTQSKAACGVIRAGDRGEPSVTATLHAAVTTTLQRHKRYTLRRPASFLRSRSRGEIQELKTRWRERRERARERERAGEERERERERRIQKGRNRASGK